jgi:hypothetical protein
VYTKNECGYNGLESNAGIEYIAQARAITYLNERINGGAPPQGGIDPDIQWEVQIGSRRADIFYYDSSRPPSSQPYVQIIEAKVAPSNYKENIWNGQVARYVNLFTNKAGMTNVGLGNALRDYVDYFFVDRGCPSGQVGVKIEGYVVDSPLDGLLLATHIPKDVNLCKKVPPGEDPEPLPEPIPLPEIGTVLAPSPQPFPFTIPNPFPLPDFDAIGNAIAEGIVQVSNDVFIAALTAALQVTMVSAEFRNWLENLRWSSVWGEPHFRTIDGLSYDMQSAGEFILAKSESSDLEIQARFSKLRGDVSVINRAAVFIDDHVVEFGNGLVIDGYPYDLSPGTM